MFLTLPSSKKVPENIWFSIICLPPWTLDFCSFLESLQMLHHSLSKIFLNHCTALSFLFVLYKGTIIFRDFYCRQLHYKYLWKLFVQYTASNITQGYIHGYKRYGMNGISFMTSWEKWKPNKRLTGISTGTSEGNLASLPYINLNGENFVVVCILDRSENKVASRYRSQWFCCWFTSSLSALRKRIFIMFALIIQTTWPTLCIFLKKKYCHKVSQRFVKTQTWLQKFNISWNVGQL